MGRVFALQEKLLAEILKRDVPGMERDESIAWECIHMVSSARIAYELAEERGVDPELAACAASVHDFGRIVTGKQAGHAEAGYEPVQEFLRGTGLFSKEEIGTLAAAVKNHSRKSEVGTEIEEIVKDADLVDCHLYGQPFSRPEQQVRFDRYLSNRRRTGDAVPIPCEEC